MVWQPGQQTPIHDHGGVWCVEGVYQGHMHITQYDVTPIDGAGDVEPFENVFGKELTLVLVIG